MKSFITALGICALLIATGGVYAVGYDWCGGGSLDGNWKDSANWTQADYPGKNQAGDTATIADDTKMPAYLSSSLSYSIASLELDAATPDASVSFTHSGGTLTVSSTTTVTGGDASSYTATITLSGGTFDPADLYLYGGDADTRQSVFHMDSGTLTKPDSTTIQDYVELQVDDGETANFGNSTCNADATLEVLDNTSGACQTDVFTVYESGAADTTTVTKTGEGVLSTTAVYVRASSSNAASLVISAGSIVTR
jgi:hypothetical protein